MVYCEVVGKQYIASFIYDPHNNYIRHIVPCSPLNAYNSHYKGYLWSYYFCNLDNQNNSLEFHISLVLLISHHHFQILFLHYHYHVLYYP